MTRQTVLGVVAGFTVAAMLGFSLGKRDASATNAPAQSVPEFTSVTTLPHPVFVAHGETVVGPVVIVATEPRLDDDQLVINFDIHSLAPVADASAAVQYAGFGSSRIVAPEDLDTVFLDHWSITTATGEIEGTVANPSARAARFDVGSDFDLESVTEIAIDSYALLTPVDSSVSLTLGAESAVVAPGVTARLLAVTEQENTIIQVELTSQRDFNFDALAISGAGPGWLSAVREAEGRPRWNLVYDAATAPSPIDLRVSGSVWITVAERVPVMAVASS